jgi:hypothetical protein
MLADMTASTLIAVVGAWTLIASVLAVVIGAVIARADSERFRPGSVDATGVVANVPAPRSGEQPVPEPASVATAQAAGSAETVSA